MKKATSMRWREKVRVSLAIFLITAVTSCATLPDSLNLAAPTRPLEPRLFFKDTGNHCLLDKELDDLSSYIIGVRKYQDTTEAIINSVNNP